MANSRGGFRFKGVTFFCDCPDFSGIHSTNIQGVLMLKDWSGSSSGAVGSKGEACKHIWATMLAMKLVDKGDVPKDVPIPSISLRALTKESYRSSSSSNPFAPLGIEGFKPYKGG